MQCMILHIPVCFESYRENCYQKSDFAYRTASSLCPYYKQSMSVKPPLTVIMNKTNTLTYDDQNTIPSYS